MDDESIKAIVDEIRHALTGRSAGRIFQLGKLSLSIDFGLRDQRHLFVSVEPSLPRLHLIKRRGRDLEKQSLAPTPFALALRKELSSTVLTAIEKEAADRVVYFQFEGADDLGRFKRRVVVVHLTGASSNLFLLDESGLITHRARVSRTASQQIGDEYRSPHSREHRYARPKEELFQLIERNQDQSPSQTADRYFESLISRQALNARIHAARTDLRKKTARQKKLLQQLQNDLKSHAGAENDKRVGDLLLANITTAKRTGNRVKLIDYFSQGQPMIEIEIDEKLTLTQEAERRFARFSRSKRAVGQIKSRIESARLEIAALNNLQEAFETLVAGGDYCALKNALSPNVKNEVTPKGKKEKSIPGTRRYVSSDGFEILVGRAARDNDHLTFKVARPNDLWLHAADYPGSHVVVRTSTRKEIPRRTIIEAAQLAAYFSRANKDPKVDVHYTQRKFLSKPKRAAPGLVRLSKFNHMTVRPLEGVKRF